MNQLLTIFTSNTAVNCHILKGRLLSENVAYGPAIDFKWDFIYLILSLLFATPMFLLRKKYHCFECGCDFKKSRKARKTPKHK